MGKFRLGQFKFFNGFLKFKKYKLTDLMQILKFIDFSSLKVRLFSSKLQKF